MSDEADCEHESHPPSRKSGFVTRTKSLATLIAAITAMVIACGSLVKPQDHSVAKKSYEELTKAVEDLDKAEDKNHDDIVALRAFLEGYLKAQEDAPTFPPPPVDAGTRTIPTVRVKSTPPLPSASPKPNIRQVPEFSTVVKSAGK